MDPNQNQPGRFSIAPVWHTFCVLAMLASLSGLSAYLKVGSPSSPLNHVSLYLLIIGFEWALFGLALWGSSSAFVGYVARAARDPRSLLMDIPAGVLLAVILVLLEPLLVRILGSTGWASLEGMRP